MPVAVAEKDGAIKSINSEASDGVGNPFTDSMSVLGQFDVAATGGTESSVGLGRFFATGLAARNLAEGFSCQLSGGKIDKDGNCGPAQ